MDGVEKLDEGRRDDGDADAGGFPALLGVGGDDLDVIPDVPGHGLGVQDVKGGLRILQGDAHMLPLSACHAGSSADFFQMNSGAGPGRGLFPLSSEAIISRLP